MRLRLVTTADPHTSVAVQHGDRWAPLRGMTGLPEGLDPGDMVSVLAADDEVWDAIRTGLEQASTHGATIVNGTPPLAPLGLRMFPLWRSEIGAVIATADRRFGTASRQWGLRGAGRRGAGALPRTTARHWDDVPLGIRGNHLRVLGDIDDAPWPSFTQALDVEFGIGLIIARPVAPGSAVRSVDVVGGYAIVGTVVARDVEHAELHRAAFGASVSRDIATIISSEVSSRHALVDGQFAGLGTRLSVQDELWAAGTTSGAHHSLDEVLTRAAQSGGLVPGEVIVLTGLPGGSGAGIDRWVSPGDTATYEVERLGSLSVRVGQPQPYLRDGALDRPVWTVVERRGNGPSIPVLDPVAWTPPSPPEPTGVLAPNTSLDAAEVWLTKGADKPEDVVVGPDGHVYAGAEDGRIYRWPVGGGEGVVVADTHGRPLGLEVTGQGDLVVCDADRGLLRLPIKDRVVGAVEVLASTHAGLALKMTNNAAVARDGTVFFTDSSTRYGIHDWRQDLLEHRPNGRLFAWHPGRGEQLDLLQDGLHFPNGLALSPDEDFLLMVETSTYTLSRYWLAGTRAGDLEVLPTELPGIPDNMCANGDGTYWIALPTRRNTALDALLPRPGVRKIVDKLPDALQPEPERYSQVVRIDGEGTILECLHGPSGDYAMVTGMRQHDGWLYLSSLAEAGIGRVRLAG